jgi:hypothetical protein
MKPKTASVAGWRAATTAGLLVATLGSAMAITAPPAEAGFRWYCSCNGKQTMYLAGTYACVLNRTAKPPYVDIPGKGRRWNQCSRQEFVAWNRKACREEGCSPPR